MFFQRFFNTGKHCLTAVLLISIVIFLGAAQLSFFPVNHQLKTEAGQAKELFLADLNQFKEKTSSLTHTLDLFSQGQTSLRQVQNSFYETKQAYKKTEYLLEYLDPELGKNINGPPLPRVVIEYQNYLTLGFKEPTHITIPPEGLQVIEELLFSEEVVPEDVKKALRLSYRLQERISGFEGNLQGQALTDKQILGSLREQLIRLVTLGLTGFDAPAAGKEINNAALSLQPLLVVMQLYLNTTNKAARSQAGVSVACLEQAIQYVRKNPDFENFDRLFFIRELADPAYAALTEMEFELLPATRAKTLITPVNEKATSIFSSTFLQPNYYAKEDRVTRNDKIMVLGKALFYDPVLSANNQRACASCHVPAKAFTDGRSKSLSFDDQGTVPRNSPTLLNAVFSKGYFWDLRADFLQDQVPGVLTQADELHGSYEEVVQKLKLSKEYQQLFKIAFKELPAGKTINTNTINRALAAYIQSLIALNSPFDKYMRRETQVLPAGVKKGFNLFMGKAACGTCHFAPIFNGTVPPRYLESETEVLGVTATADLKNPVLDKDPGRGAIIKAEVLKHSFKTPTVRNTALTGPYMHNGAFGTLAQVVDFYNQGGGAGLGLKVENQTLPSGPLNLSEEEKKNIIIFMEALTDTTLFNAIPKKLPRFPANTGLNQRPIGGRY